MNLKSLPRVSLANLPTPIHRLERLSESFGVEVYIKRDDMTGGVETGNKIRKLEYIVADALRKNYDTIVTCGGADSNHCRATAVACARFGLRAVLILRKPTAEVT
ncbi:MAG: pyridoxal-phosphate dependent enzyme, partial [Planctomycetota bacterium]|nr:pyridoxal-phosphate dependent enzyme [Planctomycetota bacterium]